MTAERWRQIKQVFEAALDVQAMSAPAWLSTCAAPIRTCSAKFCGFCSIIMIRAGRAPISMLCYLSHSLTSVAPLALRPQTRPFAIADHRAWSASWGPINWKRFWARAEWGGCSAREISAGPA